jgi:hypothetical protein
MYCTPEKIAGSKRFVAKLEKLYAAGELARVAVDEAHWWGGRATDPLLCCPGPPRAWAPRGSRHALGA